MYKMLMSTIFKEMSFIFKTWWFSYYGFMIIPYLGLCFIFNNLPIFTKVIFFLFIIWYLYNAFDFYKNELKRKKEKPY
ncbi:hypothetical protein VL07_16715 [Bacillus safensis]|nr:hypothetical protein VL07_16715 [Bacillus safensis]KML48585.1 hypothetical protein VL18_16315 [Bacillus safensis]KMN80153.1 hypothetical protein VK99_03905 [Bacillus safensis]